MDSTKNEQGYWAPNDTLDKMDLVGIYRTFHPKETKYTIFSNAHGTFSKIHYTVGHKTSLNKLKKIEIISSIFISRIIMA